ncbi:hypothetical protein ASPWEDRAFT_120272 [Aspergillus wentii DTO 134E9]|uniref:Guanine deaminase n=1 Tax=Aspergillus wentii DTO 134E9 TaxID=1073089 RepID=A0A1L9R5L8_ASPWE|nr:uncharacterized protein ASPWEDRAFT_120272 [Aspergillus wentii DTO 134E9]KAI9925290.1 hypothetical protein MW887_006217 [Aspergillus wentii]OJJ30212.1 hypothetical protein ASPWEDRAFT_120272 [Aspergillus wentii DTO 134E9]
MTSNQDKKPLAFHGTIIHSKDLTTIQIHPNTLLLTDTTGKITLLAPNTPRDEINHHLPPSTPITYLPPTKFLIPGFVDTHNHAPQWSQRGMGRGKPLLEWLEKVTFAHEAKFKDPEYARSMYTSCVEGFLKQGITTASYYGSRHGEASRILGEVCVEKGQRAFVGKCNMHRNAPDWYRDESAGESLRETGEFIEAVRRIDDGEHGLVTPILTPRFAITCDEEVLDGLGKMAEQNPDLPIQTHFNEAEAEISFTKELFPTFDTEADLYEKFGLLNNRTILAHSIFLQESEMKRLRELDCGVAHCPIPNTTMGVFMVAPVREYLRRGIKVGLGTDSGGGYSSSMLEVMKQAFMVSTARHTMSGGKDEVLSVAECFYLATMGGARVMGLEGRVGNFEVGKEFDALVVDVDVDGVMAPVEEEDSPEDVLEKFLMTGDDRNIGQVYVKGRLVRG